MLFYLIRFAVNAVAIALTAWLLPGITVADNNLGTYLLLALGLGLINAFIRPVVLLFTGQLIIATMGLFIMVVNGLMLWLLAWLFPTQLTVDGILPALLGGALMALIAMVLETLLGLTRPIGLSETPVQPKWYGMDRIAYGGGRRILENLRFQQIYETFYRYGLDMAFEQSPLADFRRSMQFRVHRITGEPLELTVPAKVRMMLQELGPVYVKMGQIASSQTQALPKNWEEELSKLQSNVPPFPAAEARQIITAELGQPPESLFAHFEAEPFAAASTAQVHRAILPSGERVVVKVQRPNIVPQVKADLGIMHDVAATLEKRTNWAKEYNMTAMLDEYAKHMLEELDYQNEAYNARQLSLNLQRYQQVHVPTIYPQFSTSKVLTMEFVQGVKITNLATIEAAGLDRAVLADNFVRCMVKQLLFDGFFHADPHPGNILVDPGTGTIIFLDMGMMGTLDQTQKLNLGDLILSLYMGDLRDLGRVIVRLSTPFKPFDEQSFYQQLERQVGRYFLFYDEGSTFSAVMSTTLSLMHEHGLRLNQDLTLAIKAMIQAEEAALLLNPNVALVDISIQESRALLTQQIDADAIVDRLTKEGVRSLKEVVRRLPTLQQATLKWLDQYERGRFTVELDTSDLARQIGQFSVAIRFLAVGFILAGILIGTAIAAAFAAQTTGAVYWLLFVVFVCLLAVSIVIGWRMIRNLPE
ncbi:MAG TPA: AarF/UbiB family protein [Caldilineaceae bacterium]|nr:AarF/UbiB family protein [Caldilineaceae bacterium]